MQRESRVNRSWLPPSYTSTKKRAVLCAPSYHGNTAYVDGSGSITMSDSWISLKPLIEEPSNLPTPRLNSSGPKDVEGIVICWSAPRTSTNCRSIHRIPSVSIRFNADATVIFLDFAGVLEAIAMPFPPGRTHRPSVTLARNMNIYKLLASETVHMAGILIFCGTLFGTSRTTDAQSEHSVRPEDGETMASSEGLDDLDVRIVRLLNSDARKSFRDISKEVDASISTVSNRIRRLEEDGVISGYVPLLNESKLGFDVLAVVGVKIHKGKLLEVQRRIAKDERVTHVYDVTGEWDSIVVVRLRTTRELDAFIKRLGSMEYVENTYTQVVLNVVKEERRVLL